MLKISTVFRIRGATHWKIYDRLIWLKFHQILAGFAWQDAHQQASNLHHLFVFFKFTHSRHSDHQKRREFRLNFAVNNWLLHCSTPRASLINSIRLANTLHCRAMPHEVHCVNCGFHTVDSVELDLCSRIEFEKFLQFTHTNCFSQFSLLILFLSHSPPAKAVSKISNSASLTTRWVPAALPIATSRSVGWPATVDEKVRNVDVNVRSES